MPSYSKYPTAIDDSTTLPISTDLVTEVKAEVVNRHRDAIIKIQNELGINPSAEFGTVKDRFDNFQSQISTLASQSAQNILLFNCDTSLQIGNVVAQNGDFAVLANATDQYSPAIGMVVEKPSETTAFVITSGEVSIFGLTSGLTYFLSETAGNLTSVPPATSGSFIQSLGFAKTSSVFVVKISNTLFFI